jgi:hypothetical protein
VWLRCHDIADLLAATLPAVGATTTYLRVWQKTLRLAADSPATARRSTVIQLAALNPRLRGSVHLTDVHAPWLVHLAQEQVWALTATGASVANVTNVGHALRWFALFLRTQWPDQGRTARGVGRAGVMAYLEWLGQRVRDSAAFQRLSPTDRRRAVVAARLLPSPARDGVPAAAARRRPGLAAGRKRAQHGRAARPDRTAPVGDPPSALCLPGLGRHQRRAGRRHP